MYEPRPARFVIALVVAAVVIAGLFVVASYASAMGGCESCHKEVHDTWAGGTHATISCVRCHVPSSPIERFKFGERVVLGMRLHLTDPSRGGLNEIPSERCDSCHNTSRNEAVVGKAVRINHAACASKERCTRCHDSVVHGADQRLVSGIDMFECLVCHTRTGQTLACDACHQGRLAKDRIATGTFAVTHGKNWKKAHGMGSVVACAACHTDFKCFKCHGSGVPHGTDFIRSHGEFARSDHQKCNSCHQPFFCKDCHGVPMPHPVDFKMKHAQIVKARGDASCKKCHADSDCLTCHTMHVHPGGAVGGGGK